VTNSKRAELKAAIMKVQMEVALLKQITFDERALTVHIPLTAAAVELADALNELTPDLPRD
jgi:hypothetical protein